MSMLPAILQPLQIDIGIKNRQKKEYNNRHQYKNPLGNTFNVPEICLKFHHGKEKRYRCCEFTLEDALDFRSRLYRTDEKRDQNDFICNFMIPVETKSHNGKCKYSKMILIQYKLQKKMGEMIDVCRNLFRAVTGLGFFRCQTVFMKRYKKELLEKGLEENNVGQKNLTKNGKKLQQVREIMDAKKEKLLNLQKGTLQTFVKAVKALKEPPKSKQTYSSQDNRKKPDHPDNPNVPKPRILLNLETMEACRICLQNGNNLIHIFNTMIDKQQSIADLIENCLPIKLDKNDEQSPNKICPNCFESIKISCRLKNDFLETQKIIDDSKAVSKQYEYREIERQNEESLQDQDLDMNLFSEIENEDYLFQQYIIENGNLGFDFEDQVEKDIFEYKNFSEDFVELFEKKPEQKAVSTTPIIQKNTPENAQSKRCYLCDVDYDTTPEKHFEEKHSIVKMERCTMCEFECEFPWFLNLHYQVHQDNFKLCPYCGKIFPNTSTNFSNHKAKCGGLKKDSGKRYKCHYCDLSYRKKRTCIDHERQNHTQEKPFKCTVCEEHFPTRISLRRHMFKHGIGATCYCEKCGKGYLQNYLLKRHQKSCLTKKYIRMLQPQ